MCTGCGVGNLRGDSRDLTGGRAGQDRSQGSSVIVVVPVPLIAYARLLVAAGHWMVNELVVAFTARLKVNTMFALGDTLTALFSGVLPLTAT